MFLCKRTCCIIHLVLPLGAFKSQLEGTYSIPLLFYTVIDSCDYIYIYVSSCLFGWWFLHVGYIPLHQFEMPFQASVLLMLVRPDDMSPSGNTFLGSNSDVRADL